MNIEAIYARIPSISSPLKRQLMTVGLLGEVLREKGHPPPVIVGGCALAYYTREIYFSYDVDLAYRDTQALDEALSALRFRKEGRYWVNEALEVVIESPASSLPGEEAPQEEVLLEDGLSCRILGLEDLIVDRLNAFKHWNSRTDGEMVELLVKRYAGEMDWAYLRNRCGRPENDTLAELDGMRQRMDRDG